LGRKKKEGDIDFPKERSREGPTLLSSFGEKGGGQKGTAHGVGGREKRGTEFVIPHPSGGWEGDLRRLGKDTYGDGDRHRALRQKKVNRAISSAVTE